MDIMSQPEAPSRSDGGTDCGGKFAILVLDDEPLVLDLIAEILRNLGHEVVPLPSPVEALRKVRLQKFDAAVVDIYMPEMSGLLFHAKLKLVDPELARRTLFVSGHFSREELRRELEGTQQFLQKPFDVNELVQKVSAVLPPVPRASAS